MRQEIILGEDDVDLLAMYSNQEGLAVVVFEDLKLVFTDRTLIEMVRDGLTELLEG